MAKGQYAGLYKSPGHFEDPEDYMNMADSMEYFKVFGAAPETVVDSNFKARKGFVPIEPDNDELMGLRNLEALNAVPELDSFGNVVNQEGRAKNLELLGGLSPSTAKPTPSTKVNNPTYGFMKLAELAKAGKLAPQSPVEQPEIKPDMHTNEAFVYYTNLRDKLKKKIDDLKAEIAFRDKVRKIKARMDPLWKAARIQAIFTGDMTPLYNIMNRYDQLEKAERDELYRDKALQQTADLAKMNKEAEDKQKQESYKRALDSKVKLANFTYNEYRTNDADSRAKRFNAYMDLKNAAEDMGLTEADIAKLLPPDVYNGLYSVYHGNAPQVPTVPTVPTVDNEGSAPAQAPTGFLNVDDLTKSVNNDITNKAFDKALSDIENHKHLFAGGDTDAMLTGLKQKVEIAKKNEADRVRRVNEAREKKEKFKRDNAKTTFAVDPFDGSFDNPQDVADFESKAKAVGLTVEYTAPIEGNAGWYKKPIWK